MGTGEEDKDDDLYSGGDNEDSSDDDTAIPGMVATFIGNATAPAGYAIVDVCPPLETNLDLNNFIGKTILVGHDSKQARGWFRGLVHSTGLSAADKRKTPTANCIIKYVDIQTRSFTGWRPASSVLHCMEWLRGGSN